MEESLGIGLVLLFWVVLLGGFAAAVATMLRGAVKKFVSSDALRGRRAQKFAFLLPFACVAFWILSFLAYAAINDRVFHRDPGLGDSWYAPIPNGVVLGAIDVPEVGYVGTLNGSTLVMDVTRLQVEKAWIAGMYDSAARGFEGSEAGSSKGFFILDAFSHQRQDFTTAEAFESALGQRGLRSHLRPFDVVYREFRKTWFDDLAVVWMLGVPVVALLALALYIVRARRGSLRFPGMGG